ncbi:MAG: phosphoribosylaminoimidazole-succinocarboxamide synthase [Dehalococcoidales bacterium]|nr:phosphoribosylaminoimidazole-succinocarboxamide synthase [Dehalococcoidales bacterium]
MIKHLKFQKIQAVERRGALMLVWLLDDEGNMYDWAPKWDDVEQIFLKQINVERFNKPESEWLNKFAKTAQNVVEGAQRIQSAVKVSGHFDALREGELVLNKSRFTPGFEVTLLVQAGWNKEPPAPMLPTDVIAATARRYREAYERLTGKKLIPPKPL